MSLILDALKKLDREKTAKNGGKMDITAEILKAGDTPQKSSILPLVLTLVLTAFLAAMGTYLVFGGPGSRTGDPRSTAPAAPAQATPVTATPLPPVPAAPTDKPPAPTDRSPAAPPPAVSEAMKPDSSKKGSDPLYKRKSGSQCQETRESRGPSQGRRCDHAGLENIGDCLGGRAFRAKGRDQRDGCQGRGLGSGSEGSGDSSHPRRRLVQGKVVQGENVRLRQRNQGGSNRASPLRGCPSYRLRFDDFFFVAAFVFVCFRELFFLPGGDLRMTSRKSLRVRVTKSFISMSSER